MSYRYEQTKSGHFAVYLGKERLCSVRDEKTARMIAQAPQALEVLKQAFQVLLKLRTPDNGEVATLLDRIEEVLRGETWNVNRH